MPLKKKGYQLFIEFNNAYGLKKGINVNLKGVTIGYVRNISLRSNNVVVLVYINSLNVLIPKSSLIEVNQVGLFNDIVIDITIVNESFSFSYYSIDPTSVDCLESAFMCSNFYVKGYKGLNYDDLVRSTTRIAQRFDDPRFFNLFYVFLQNGFDISNEIMSVFSYISYFFSYLVELVVLMLLKYFV